MTKLERIYTIPLGKAYDAVRNKRVPRAVDILRQFAIRHMKADGHRVTISQALNKHLWAQSIQKPPRKIKVRLVKDDAEVKAYLHDEKLTDEKKKDDKLKAEVDEKKASEVKDTKIDEKKVEAKKESHSEKKESK